MNPRFPVVCSLAVLLTLVLAILVCPAEGFVLYEQREASGPPLPELRPQRHQTVIDLNGAWEWRVGEKGQTYSGWIPSCFDAQAMVIYRRSFTLADSLRPYYFELYLPAIHYSVEVWINGSFVSSFTGSHLAFSCNIDRNHLRFGSPNEILLKVDGRLSARKTLPVRPQILQPRSYGGVFSGVYLRAVPAWSVEDVSLLPESLDDSTAIRANVRVRIAQHAAMPGGLDSSRGGSDVRVWVMLQDSTGRVISEGRSDRIVRGRNENLQMTVALPRFAASLWWPARPVIYQMTAALVAGTDTLHQLTHPLGFKTVEIRSGDLFLNGQRLRLRGMDYVPEQNRGARALSVSQIQQDLRKMRDLGMVVVRVPFGPPPPELLNVADRMGMLVLAEAGLDWIPGEILGHAEYQTLSRQAVQRLINGARDHPCILAWGLGSQLDWDDPVVQGFSRSLYRAVKELDQRPCYIETMRPQDRPGLTDFVLASWRPDGEPTVRPLAGSVSMPMVVSRLGRMVAWGGSGYAASSSGIVNQAQVLIQQVLDIEDDEAMDGYLIHAFADYHGSSPLLSQPLRSDACLYTFGVVGFDRQERIAYFKLRDLEQTGQASPPVPAETPSRSPMALPVTGLAALIVLSAEMRRNNVFRQNLRRVFLHPHGFHSDLRYRRFLHTGQPLLLWILESVTLALLTASFFFALRESFRLDYYLTHFLPWPRFKAWLVNVVWDPTHSVIYFAGTTALVFALKTVGVRLLAMLFRERVDFWQAANYIIWSFAACLYLLPLAVVFYRVMDMPGFSTAALILVAVGLIWCILRLLAALRTGYATTAIRLYGAVLAIGVVAAVVVIALLDNRLGTLAYLGFFGQVFR